MRLVCLILFTLSLVLSSFAESLKVMTYNIRFPNKADGANFWDNRRDVAIDMLRRHSPDLIGTQELFFRQGDEIVTALPEYVWLGTARYGIHTNEYMGIFYKKERFTLQEMGQFWLSETPSVPGSMNWGMTLPRLATWARLLDNRTGKAFTFIDTHFPHRAQDDAARTECAKVLASFIAKLPSDMPVILTGDFNADAGSNAHKVLTQTMKDAWVASPSRKGPAGTFHNFKGGEGRGDRIDWILHRGPWKATHAEFLLDHQGELYPSDHYPVIAVYELP